MDEKRKLSYNNNIGGSHPPVGPFSIEVDRVIVESNLKKEHSVFKVSHSMWDINTYLYLESYEIDELIILLKSYRDLMDI